MVRCWKYGLKIWSEHETEEVSSRTRAAIQAAEGHTTCRNIRHTSYSDWKVTFRFLATGEYQLGFNQVTVRMWNTSTCVPSGKCPIKCTDTWQEIEHVECEQTSPKKSKQAERTGCCRKNVTLRYVFTVKQPQPPSGFRVRLRVSYLFLLETVRNKAQRRRYAKFKKCIYFTRHYVL